MTFAPRPASRIGPRVMRVLSVAAVCGVLVPAHQPIAAADPQTPATEAVPQAKAAEIRLVSRTGSQAVALTFDDGPSKYTPAVLALLEKYEVQATFCIVGKRARERPDLVRQIAEAGHALCNHSDTHTYGSGTDDRTAAQLSADWAAANRSIRAGLNRSEDALVRQARIAWFRHPGGNWEPRQLKYQTAARLGMRPLHWSVDPKDYQKPGTQAIVDHVLGRTRPGSIVLLHDGGGDRRQTVAALEPILKGLKAKGYDLVALR